MCISTCRNIEYDANISTDIYLPSLEFAVCSAEPVYQSTNYTARNFVFKIVKVLLKLHGYFSIHLILSLIKHRYILSR